MRFGDVAGIVLAFEALGDDRETPGDVAGDFGGLPGRVEAVRIGPDGFQPRLNFRIAQIVHADAEALRIGELGVVLPLPRKIGVELDDVTDIDEDDEGRIAVFDRQVAGVVDGLRIGGAHDPIPAARAAPGVAELAAVRFGAEQIGGARIFGLAAGGLLGFEHKAAALVAIDIELGGGAIGVAIV